jgi:hypothetical protein
MQQVIPVLILRDSTKFAIEEYVAVKRSPQLRSRGVTSKHVAQLDIVDALIQGLKDRTHPRVVCVRHSVVGTEDAAAPRFIKRVGGRAVMGSIADASTPASIRASAIAPVQ